MREEDEASNRTENNEARVIERFDPDSSTDYNNITPLLGCGSFVRGRKRKED